MDHAMKPAAQAIVRHLERCFPASPAIVEPAERGPIRQLVPDMHIVRIRPAADRGEWLYVTASLWEATHHHGHGLEFALLAPSHSETHIRTLTMTAFYHASGGNHTLDHGHTVPIGVPWLKGSKCTYLLVSLPYPWGPDFETCEVPDGHARILWLLPITKAEKEFRHKEGLEALEQRFDDAGIIPTDPSRASVVVGRPGLGQRLKARRAR